MNSFSIPALILALLPMTGCAADTPPEERTAPSLIATPVVQETPGTPDPGPIPEDSAMTEVRSAAQPEVLLPVPARKEQAERVGPNGAKPAEEFAPAAFDHSTWNALLQAHVSNDGMVNYGAFGKDARFAAYLKNLSAQKPATWPAAEQIAFWVNVYNAFTIQLMLDHPGVKSIKDIDGPWKKKFFSIGGEQMDLDHVEHAILREKLGDERIHFAIVCASFSCPQLWNKAYTAEGLDKQLDDAARRFINDPLRNKLGAAPELSEIFNWFKGDFTKKGTLVAYINKYAKTPLPADARIKHLVYDWKLNGTR